MLLFFNICINSLRVLCHVFDSPPPPHFLSHLRCSLSPLPQFLFHPLSTGFPLNPPNFELSYPHCQLLHKVQFILTKLVLGALPALPAIGWPTKSHIIKENRFSLSQQLSATNGSSPSSVASCPPSSLHVGIVVWLELVQVCTCLYMCVHACAGMLALCVTAML